MEENKVIEVKVEYSRGYGKSGKLAAYVRPDFDCFNRSRRVADYSHEGLREMVNTVIRKWYAPKLVAYKIDGYVIVSNNEENALKEFYRVCDKEQINIVFPVYLYTLSPKQTT